MRRVARELPSQAQEPSVMGGDLLAPEPESGIDHDVLLPVPAGLENAVRIPVAALRLPDPLGTTRLRACLASARIRRLLDSVAPSTCPHGLDGSSTS
jgi:hypothetical protein